METNKVEAFGKVLIDLTNDTVTPSAMVQGVTAHDRSGAIIEGELDWDSKQDVIDDLDTIRDNSELATWIVPGGVVKEYTSDMQAKPGDCVAYNGAVWRSLGWSMGWTPGDPSGNEPRMWERISLTTLGNKTANLITTDGTHTNDTRLAIDPNAQELEFVTSDEVDALSQKIDNAMSLSCNRNMLDNWYFGNPVNQRNFETRYANGNENYTIDRWYHVSWTAANYAAKNDGYIRLYGDSGANRFGQKFENTISGTLTFSIMYQSTNAIDVYVVEGANYRKIVTLETKGGVFVGDVTFDTTGIKEIFLQTTLPNSTVNIMAVKLELGSRQTLAHNENGQWVLNEIPDYGEQLRRCQRYFFSLNLNSELFNANFFLVHAITTTVATAYIFSDMHADPYAIITGSVVLRKGTTDKPISSITAYKRGNGITLTINSNGLVAGDTYVLRTNEGNITFSTDL